VQSGSVPAAEENLFKAKLIVGRRFTLDLIGMVKSAREAPLKQKQARSKKQPGYQTPFDCSHGKRIVSEATLLRKLKLLYFSMKEVATAA